MSVLEWFKRWRLRHTVSDADVPTDNTTAMTRAMGGSPDWGTPTTTATGTDEGPGSDTTDAER